jgi:3-hexulose-6-phosphate synthase/6-phospho-3-hexuloisomerase
LLVTLQSKVVRYFLKAGDEIFWWKMEDTLKAIGEITSFLHHLPSKLKKREVDRFIEILIGARRVFVAGAGRSGLVAKAFATRLMHLDFEVYIVGETITPALRPGDILIALSGSGETDLIVESARIAKKIGAKIIAITSYSNSSLGRLADLVVTVPGRTKVARTTRFMRRELAGEHASLAPLGTLFEIGAMVFLDAVIATLMKRLGKKEEDLKAKHATIE